MDFKKAELIDKKGYVQAVLYRTKDWDLSLGGVLYTVNSWDATTLKPSYPLDSFVGDFAIKWDGCSHWSLYGEDYNSDQDSYYHLCGLDNYYQFFASMLFATECAKEWHSVYYEREGYGNPEDNFDDDLYDTFDRISLLDFYEIKYYNDLDEMDEFMLKSLKEY